ncbi:MAG TPA: hypothetical protein VFM14_01685 [Gemmatimonadales bacterium]|nr:hypothetical protein [Gemmatimonadales bacterium]
MHILLVHGLGRSPLSLLRLARDLQRAGHSTELAGYVAAVEHFPRIRARIRRRLRRIAATGQPYAAIGHSLGGVLLRTALVGWPPDLRPPQHLVMLGTPDRPPRLARRLRWWWPYRLLNGQTGQLLARQTFFDALPRVTVPCTVIAGTRGWRSVRAPFAGIDNDGIVAVPEVRPSTGAAFVPLPVGHTFMMNDPRVRTLVRAILTHAVSMSPTESR